MTTKRKVYLHSIVAMNGDLDKTSYAMELTKRLARDDHNSKMLFIDCDMHSSNFALKYHLKAPKLTAEESGFVNFVGADNNDNLFYDSTATADLIVERSCFFSKEIFNKSYVTYPKSSAPYLVFFNDLMNYLYKNERSAITAKSYFWQCANQNYKNVYFLPSSPLENDVKQSFEWSFGEPFDWLHSFH